MTGVAWYDIKGKGWLRDLIIILHLPYTLWHLSYALIGAALAPQLNWGTMGWTVLAFFLGMGIGGHCLDELCGRPLRTKIPGVLLWTLAVVSILGAVSIGVFVGVRETVWIIPCIIFGGFIVFAYNLEWARGFFHYDFWFGFAWGAFPVMTAYIAQTHTVSWGVVLVAGACILYSMAQRVLSFHGRFFRRKVRGIEGRYYLYGEGPVCPGSPDGGPYKELTREMIIGPAEVGLKFMNGTIVIAAIGLLLSHI